MNLTSIKCQQQGVNMSNSEINKIISCYVLGCETSEKNNPNNLDFYK